MTSFTQNRHRLPLSEAGARHAGNAVEPDPDRPGAVPDRCSSWRRSAERINDAGGAAGDGRARSTSARRSTAGAPPLREFMLKQTRETDLALFVELCEVAAAGDGRRPADARGDPGLRHLGAEDRLPDGLLPVRPVPADRSRRVDDAAVDGHAAAAAGDDLAAVQGAAVRDDRRLEPAGRRLARAELSPEVPMSEALVVGIVRQAIETGRSSSACRCCSPGLLAGVLVSMFQTVTSIQDNVLGVHSARRRRSSSSSR